MPQILPIRGLRYTAAAGPLHELLAPPYDVVSASQEQALRARNVHNAIHLELAAGGDERYARVAALVEAWTAAGALERDAVPMLYAYEQTFDEGGTLHRRRALIAGVEAQPWEEGAVKPHEFTMSAPKEDRLRLLEATRTQFSPAFMIARDRAGQLTQFLGDMMAARPPDVTAETMDGDHHALWAVEAGRFEMRYLAPLFPESFYIADGHHRYETAVTYRQRLAEREGTLPRDHPARFAMTGIVAASDPGLVIRPIHRVVPRVAPADALALLVDAFAIDDGGPTGAVKAPAEGCITALGLEPGRAHSLRLRAPALLMGRVPAGRSEEWAAIGPNVLRYGVLEPLWGITDDDLRAGAVEYAHEASEVAERVKDGACGFLLNPVGIGEVMTLADRGERMPQKSTFFHPKLGTGLVFHPLYP